MLAVPKPNGGVKICDNFQPQEVEIRRGICRICRIYHIRKYIYHIYHIYIYISNDISYISKHGTKAVP